MYIWFGPLRSWPHCFRRQAMNTMNIIFLNSINYVCDHSKQVQYIYISYRSGKTKWRPGASQCEAAAAEQRRRWQTRQEPLNTLSRCQNGESPSAAHSQRWLAHVFMFLNISVLSFHDSDDVFRLEVGGQLSNTFVWKVFLHHLDGKNTWFRLLLPSFAA